MNLAVEPLRVIESVERRVLGAFQLVDAVTGLALGLPAAIEVRRAVITVGGVPEAIALPDGAVRIVRSRTGAFVLLRVPSFDDYTASFGVPTAFPTMRLRVRVTDAGPHYLPQEFQIDLPRPLDPKAELSVFEPQPVAMMRAPSAPAQDGWVVLRASVRRAGPGSPTRLGGVLVRAFRSPRGAQDRPLGVGMTEWRGNALGEALVAVTGVERFRPGSGSSPIEILQGIELEATGDNAFTVVGEQLPDVSRLIAGTDADLVRHVDRPPGLVVTVRPDERPEAQPDLPIQVRAGREYVVVVTMP